VFIAGWGAVDLDQLREIYAVTKGRLDGRFVRNKSISGDLEFPACCIAQAFDENVGCRLVAFAQALLGLR